MFDWGQSVNAWETVLGAGVQTVVVIIAAVLTWGITRSSERRSARAERVRLRESQLDAFGQDLDRMAERVRRMLRRRKVTDRDLELWTRFINRVYWESEPDEYHVDVWLRTNLTIAFDQAMSAAQTPERDEYREHVARDSFNEIDTEFWRWRDNKIGPAWFAEDLEGMGRSIRVYSGRLGSPDTVYLTRGRVTLDVIRRSFRELREAQKYPWRAD